MAHERILDVSELEPPEPLERALEAIETLAPGEYLRMLHHREPFPLYTILDDSGFRYLTREGVETLFEIFIWRRNDGAAQSAVHAITGASGGSRG